MCPSARRAKTLFLDFSAFSGFFHVFGGFTHGWLLAQETELKEKLTRLGKLLTQAHGRLKGVTADVLVAKQELAEQKNQNIELLKQIEAVPVRFQPVCF